MPLYEYQCAGCGRFEIIQKFSDAPLSACPTCGREVQKVLSAPAFQFKGTGWYITDYARKSSEDGATKEAKEATREGKEATREAKEATREAKEATREAKEASGTSTESSPHKTTTKENSATGSSPTK